MKKLLSIAALLLVTACGGGGSDDDTPTSPPPIVVPTTGASIAGRLLDTNGKTMPSTTVLVSGTQSQSVATDTGGNFVAVGLKAGTYSVTATKFGYAFNTVTLTLASSGKSTANLTGSYTTTPEIKSYIDAQEPLRNTAFIKAYSSVIVSSTANGNFCSDTRYAAVREVAMNSITTFMTSVQTYIGLTKDKTLPIDAVALASMLGAQKAEDKAYYEKQFNEHRCPGDANVYSTVIKDLFTRIDSLYALIK